MADPILERELSDGEFRRQQSRFRDWVGLDPRTGVDSGLPALAGRYHLYVSLACPWCHRAVILRELAGLREALPISYLAPYRDERGWAFTGEPFSVRGEHGWSDEYVDRLHGWRFISEAYAISDADFEGRITVPVLWDTHTQRIVNNDSADLVRMMGDERSLGGLGDAAALALYPPELREEIDALNERIYETVNNGVYRAGFARLQGAYERAFNALFESFDWLERLLGERRFLAGARPTEADWRLFPTLVRFDEVYNVHFRCNRRRVVDYANLWGYARELYQWPGVAPTVAMDQIKRHYYTTHDELNPKKIIPLGPDYDWWEPHGRDR
ncbi:MAG TPA: glutathione S-transferase C-terminal domain-containing protein [Solirubrobacteraceae bacterium]